MATHAADPATADTEPGDAWPPDLDPALIPLLELLAGQEGPPIYELTPAEAREIFRRGRVADGDPVAVRSVTDRTVPGPAGDVPVRIVVPETGDLDPTGVLVWYHGGGFVIGDLDTSEPTARRLAEAAGCVVVSVGYRLAPEDPAPAALDDCLAATRWVAGHLDELGVPGARIAVGGDSAGANLAAGVAIDAAAGGWADLAAQILVYPVTDLTMGHPSIRENGERYFLTERTMHWFHDSYLGGGVAADDPSVSPLFHDPAALAGTPPALVVTAGFDPLRDEGRAYAEKLRAAGVPVEAVEYPGMIHGFLSMSALTPVAVEAAERAAAALRTAFAP